MRFDRYPLDQHSCKFMVGSSNYDETRMTFSNLKLHFDQSSANTIVDYQIEIGGKLYTCEEYLAIIQVELLSISNYLCLIVIFL